MIEGVKLARPAVNRQERRQPALAHGHRFVFPFPSVAGARYRIEVKYSESIFDFWVFASALKLSNIKDTDLGSFFDIYFLDKG